MEKDDKYIYIISFSPKEKSFIYDVVLKKVHKFLDNIPKDAINQETMDYQDKLDLFIEALKEIKKKIKNKNYFKKQ